MNAKIMRLAHKLHDGDLAEKLFIVGLETPREIKAAEDKDIEAAVGKDGLAKVRDAFPKA